MRRVAPGNGEAKNGSSHLASDTTKAMKDYPSLVAHCCEMRYEDGSARKPGWFTVKTMGSAWVVQVKDPDSCCQLQTTASTVDDALIMAELLLSSSDAPWEPDQWLQASQSRKKKGS